MDLDLVWAVLASVVTSFALGFAWYGLLFAKPWMKAMGWDRLSEAEVKAKQKGAMPGYVVSLVTAALTAVILWYIFDWSNTARGTGAIVNGAVLGVLGWVAFLVPAASSTAFFEGRPWMLASINGAYYLIVFALTGVWVGVFGA
jgi:hypothetical protein